MSVSESPDHDRVQVLLIDDHGLVRAGIRALILSSTPRAVVHEASSVEMAWQALQRYPIDVAFLDLDLQGPETGLDLLKRAREAGIASRMVILSATSDLATVTACLQAGASGYLPKASEDPATLAKAVEVTLAGGVYLPGPFGEAALAEAEAGNDLAGLSPRLQEVLVYVCQGLPNKLIARQLGITEGTVRKTYMTELLRHFGVARRTALMYEVARRDIRMPLRTHAQSS